MRGGVAKKLRASLCEPSDGYSFEETRSEHTPNQRIFLVMTPPVQRGYAGDAQIGTR